MSLHVHGYTKLVNGKLVTVGDYSQDRAAAQTLAEKATDRPPTAAKAGVFGQHKTAAFPAGRDVADHFPEPVKINYVKAPKKINYVKQPKPVAKIDYIKKPVVPKVLQGSAVHSQSSMAPKADIDEDSALFKYTGNFYRTWNKALRSGDPLNKWADDVEALDRLLSRAETKSPLQVYRGVAEVPWLEGLQPGSVITDKGFVSTSSDEDLADRAFASVTSGALMKIHVPAGSNALSVPSTLTSPGDLVLEEQEVLLPRDSQFEVQSIEDHDGLKIVVMKLVQKGANSAGEETKATSKDDSQEAIAASAGSFLVVPRRRVRYAAQEGILQLAVTNDAADAWMAAAAPAVHHILLVIQNNPGKTIDQILQRPDIQDALKHAGAVGASVVSQAIAQAWHNNGGETGAPYLQSLLEDAQKNGVLFASRMNKVLPTADKSQISNVLGRYRLRASAGESVAATRARVDTNTRKMISDGVEFHRWVVRSSHPCKTCQLLDGTVVKIGEPFDAALGGVLPVYFDLLGPPRHPGCQCETESA